jgi:ribosome-associated protein
MDKRILLSELTYKATRSSGPGGQHVNKTSTRVELHWSLDTTKAFSEEEVLRLRESLRHRLTKEGSITLASEQTRSQLRNKEDVTKRFFNLLEVGVTPPKIRKKTRPSKMAKRKRLQAKKRHGEKKLNRKKPEY